MKVPSLEIPTAGNEIQEGNVMIRPREIEDIHLEFLDELRESGVTNMWGAGEFIEDEFNKSQKESRLILTYWMTTFGKDDR